MDIFTFSRAARPISVDNASLRRDLDKALYKSQWAVATRWLHEQGLLDEQAEPALEALLQAGAKTFGLSWALPKLTLAPLLAAARNDSAGFEAAQAALAALTTCRHPSAASRHGCRWMSKAARGEPD